MPRSLRDVDAVVVGGGPAGSTCARVLKQGGLKVLVIDAAKFPRVKLCAGWVSPPIWDVLGLSPSRYPRGLWEWDRGHITFAGNNYTLPSKGYFIRRFEFDDFLLKRSKAPVIEGHFVRSIEKDGKGRWVVDGTYRATYLIGAGGSHCPVARALFPKKTDAPAGTQEREFQAGLKEIAACRMGKNGEPQLLLHDDLRGYSWNVPKSDWLNIGTGTFEPREVLPAWKTARAFFEGNGKPGTVPVSARPELDHMKGHGYYVYIPEHLEHCQKDNAFLIGDSLGLAQPTTGEGILPAVLSGKILGQAIAEVAPESYASRLRSHPVFRDYRILYAGREIALKVLGLIGAERLRRIRLFNFPVVMIFAALFSGKTLPGRRLMESALAAYGLLREKSPSPLLSLVQSRWTALCR
jgi:flavin-dependent dehydrogenase